MPERDYRKTFDENTPLRTLAQNEDAMAILMRLTPALGGMAAENNPEFSNGGLADFRGMGFLPIEPEKLEQAMRTMLGIGPKVRLVPPKTIARSEGKAVRVIDHRKLHD